MTAKQPTITTTLTICDVSLLVKLLCEEKGEERGRLFVRTYHSLHRYWFNKTVEYLREHTRTESRPAHLERIPLHAFLPIIANSFHSRHATVALASVFFEFSCADSHFGKDLGGFHHGALVDVVADGGVDAVEDVHEAEGEEAIQEKLDVVGESAREVGVLVYECKDRGDEALNWRGLFMGPFAAAGTFFGV